MEPQILRVSILDNLGSTTESVAIQYFSRIDPAAALAAMRHQGFRQSPASFLEPFQIGSHTVQTKQCVDYNDVFERLTLEQDDFTFLPLENSVSGVCDPTLRALGKHLESIYPCGGIEILGRIDGVAEYAYFIPKSEPRGGPFERIYCQGDDPVVMSQPPGSKHGDMDLICVRNLGKFLNDTSGDHRSLPKKSIVFCTFRMAQLYDLEVLDADHAPREPPFDPKTEKVTYIALGRRSVEAKGMPLQSIAHPRLVHHDKKPINPLTGQWQHHSAMYIMLCETLPEVMTKITLSLDSYHLNIVRLACVPNYDKSGSLGEAIDMWTCFFEVDMMVSSPVFQKLLDVMNEFSDGHTVGHLVPIIRHLTHGNPYIYLERAALQRAIVDPNSKGDGEMMDTDAKLAGIPPEVFALILQRFKPCRLRDLADCYNSLLEMCKVSSQWRRSVLDDYPLWKHIIDMVSWCNGTAGPPIRDLTRGHFVMSSSRHAFMRRFIGAFKNLYKGPVYQRVLKHEIGAVRSHGTDGFLVFMLPWDQNPNHPWRLHMYDPRHSHDAFHCKLNVARGIVPRSGPIQCRPRTSRSEPWGCVVPIHWIRDPGDETEIKGVVVIMGTEWEATGDRWMRAGAITIDSTSTPAQDTFALNLHNHDTVHWCTEEQIIIIASPAGNVIVVRYENTDKHAGLLLRWVHSVPITLGFPVAQIVENRTPNETLEYVFVSQYGALQGWTLQDFIHYDPNEGASWSPTDRTGVSQMDHISVDQNPGQPGIHFPRGYLAGIAKNRTVRWCVDGHGLNMQRLEPDTLTPVGGEFRPAVKPELARAAYALEVVGDLALAQLGDDLLYVFHWPSGRQLYHIAPRQGGTRRELGGARWQFCSPYAVYGVWSPMANSRVRPTVEGVEIHSFVRFDDDIKLIHPANEDWNVEDSSSFEMLAEHYSSLTHGGVLVMAGYEELDAAVSSDEES